MLCKIWCVVSLVNRLFSVKYTHLHARKSEKHFQLVLFLFISVLF